MLSISASVPAPSPNEPLPIYFDDDWNYDIDVVVLAGAGAGTTARALLGRGQHRIIAFLPEGASADDLPRMVSVVRSKKELWNRLLLFSPPPGTVTVRKIPGGGFSDDLHTQLADRLEKAVFNRATFIKKGETWTRHMLANYHHLATWQSVGALRGAFAGKPCLIVSPGPSLAKNIEQIKELQDRALIIASNRSVSPLCKAGIRPHLAVVADPLDLHYQLPREHLDGVGALLLEIVAHPAMFDLSPQRRLSYCGIGPAHLATFQPLGLGVGSYLPSGGSVATVGFRLALELGCTTLVLAGQDLALDGDRYYVESAPDGDTRIEIVDEIGHFRNTSSELLDSLRRLGELPDQGHISQRFLEVLGWDGVSRVSTSFHFDMYRRWYETVLEELRGVEVYNCTEGGAHIRGAKHVPLSQYVREHATAPWKPLEVMDEASRRQALPSAANLARQLDAMMESIEGAKAALDRCEVISAAFDRQECFAQLDEAEAALTASLRGVPYMTNLCQPRLEAAQRSAANAASLEDALAASRELYETLRDCTEYIEPLLREARRRFP